MTTTHAPQEPMADVELPPLNYATVRELGWSVPLGSLSEREIFKFAHDHARAAIAADRARRQHQQPSDPAAALGCAPADRAQPWARNDELTRDILELVGFSPLPETMAAWTDEQAQQAEEWAGAAHLHASDNDDVIVPPKPAFLPEPWKGDGDDIWGPGPTKF